MIQVTHWESKQHYHKKDGPPLWIKLYRDWISNEHVKLDMDDHLRYVMVGLWCLAARHKNEIPDRLKYLTGELATEVTQEDLDALKGFGFITLDGGSRASLDSGSRPMTLDLEEKRREEKKGMPSPVSVAVENFLSQVGVEWDVKSRSLEDWSLEIQANHPGIDIPPEIQKAADWHSGSKKKPKRPSMALRNWLGNAVKFKKENAPKPKGQKYERLRV